MRGRVWKLMVLALIAAAVAAVLRALRGEPTPVFSNHPTVTGGPDATRAPSPPTAPPRNAPPEPVEPVVAISEIEPEPVAAVPAEPAEPAGEQAWVEPIDGECPDGYPIKAKVKSGIFHQPGTATYERTKPDRCYPSVEAAEADGYRAPKR